MSTSKDKILQKLARIKQEFEALETRLAAINPQKDFDSYHRLSKEHAALEPIIHAYDRYARCSDQYKQNESAIAAEKDEAMKAMFREEQTRLVSEMDDLITELNCLLLPKDPNDDKNIMIEIRAGAGGDEAGLFVADLLRMYERYCARQRWKLELLSMSSQGVGGYREVIAMMRGANVFSRLKFEAGVHRVQRVPKTEAQGRIHTSTVTVAILPEADEVEVQLNPNELRVDVYRSSGPGGQSVNTTDSAVRITHIPTGIVVTMQDEKSQHKNKAKALKILRNKLYARAQSEQQAEIASSRRAQVGTGERSERIRTYNFPQGRVSDHRIGLTLYDLENILDGELDKLIDPLISDYHEKQISDHGDDV